MNEVYVAIQQGVYRHAVIGAFTTLDAATAVGCEAVTAEDDHYHDVVVLACPLDGRGERLLGRCTWRREPSNWPAAKMDDVDFDVWKASGEAVWEPEG